MSDPVDSTRFSPATHVADSGQRTLFASDAAAWRLSASVPTGTPIDSIADANGLDNSRRLLEVALLLRGYAG